MSALLHALRELAPVKVDTKETTLEMSQMSSRWLNELAP